MTRSSSGKKHKTSRKGSKYSGLRRKLTLPKTNSPVHYQEEVDDLDGVNDHELNNIEQEEQEELEDRDVKLENEHVAAVTMVSYTSSFTSIFFII